MKSEPGAHPEPPPDFYSRTLPIATHGGSLFRTHLHTAAPLYFGRTGRNRFDDPKGRYGVLYAARDPFGAFVETFGQETGNRTVGVGELKMRRLTEFCPATPLSLVDLCGQGCLARIGADGRLFAANRAIARRWSRAIYEHPDRLKLHGILYPARHNHTRSAVALFDREAALPRLEVNRTVSWYSPEGDMRSTLAAILDLYGFNVVETEMRPDKKRPGSLYSMSSCAGRPDGSPNRFQWAERPDIRFAGRDFDGASCPSTYAEHYVRLMASFREVAASLC